MPRTGLITDRLSDSYKFIGNGAYNTNGGLILPTGEMIAKYNSNGSYVLFGTTITWLAAPTGYYLTTSWAVYGDYLYCVAVKTSTPRSATLLKVDVYTRSVTVIKTWSSGTTPLIALYGSMYQSVPYMGIVTWTSSGPNSTLESLNLSNDSVAVLRDHWVSDAQVCAPAGVNNFPGRVSDDGYIYYTTYPDTSKYYFRKTLLSSYGGTLITSNLTGYWYKSWGYGYHTSEDLPNRIYNEARSTYWDMLSGVKNAMRIGNQGSDGAWLIALPDGLYRALLDTGGSVTKVRIYAATMDDDYSTISGFHYGRGQRYDAANPSDFSMFTHPTYTLYYDRLFSFSMGRGELG